MSYRFILDTNVLDSESIETLAKAHLQDACRSGRCAFYTTPVLLRERLSFISKDRIPVKAVRPITFVLKLKWQRIFNELGGPEGILAGELEGKSQTQYLFTDCTRIKQNLRLILNGGEFGKEARSEILGDQLQWSQNKRQNRDTRRSMRDEVNKRMRNNPRGRRYSRFSTFRERVFEREAIDKIEHKIDSTISKDTLVEYWRKHRGRCPYFNKLIEGRLFVDWHAMAVEQEPKIDINAYEDIEHLVYLVGVDGIVSNEKGFIKTACTELFPSKDFLSTDQFVKRLRYE